MTFLLSIFVQLYKAQLSPWYSCWNELFALQLSRKLQENADVDEKLFYFSEISSFHEIKQMS